MLKNINLESFDKEVLKNSKITLVDFYATWCPPCKMLAPVLEKISNSRVDFDICKVNTDEEQELAMNYSIQSIPTMILFKDGKPVDKLIGYNDENVILDMIERNM